MARVEWSDDLSVHVEEIDTQHRKLIRLINTLHDFTLVDKGKDVVGRVRGDIMGTMLSELLDYTVYHFSTEERLLQQHQYPGYAAHKAQHDEFTKQINELKAKLDRGELLLTNDVMNFLLEWLKNHIIGSDKHIGDSDDDLSDTRADTQAS